MRIPAVLYFCTFWGSWADTQSNHVLRRNSASIQVATNGASLLTVRSVKTRKEPPLKVAYVVFITDIGTPGWKDAIDILAHSINKAAAKSKHNVELLALAPMNLPADKEQHLLQNGYKAVLRRPQAVEPKEVQHKESREHMERVMGQSAHMQFLQADETIKYWGLSLTDYDRALVLDADTMVLDPMDELMERPEDFIGTYDHGLDITGSTMPPTQGGFLLFRPNAKDFENVKALTREGDWGGAGWKQSGIGYCYGGVGPDGLLSYYFSQDALGKMKLVGKDNLPEGIETNRIEGSRALYVDRPVYDVVLNERLRDELKDADQEKTIANVKSVHFTGDCIKPWTCSSARDWFCAGLMNKWWELRAELEASRNLPASPKQCTAGGYQPIGG